MAFVLASIGAACGGSSESSGGPGPNAGAGGSLGISGSFGTTAGRSSGSSGSTVGGTQTGGGQRSVGGEAAGPQDGGSDAGGAPDRHEPPVRPGMGGAAGDDANCPLAAPTDKSVCAGMLKCDYPALECKCEGPGEERQWKCKAPPKPMTMCPPRPPKAASACKAADPPAPPCHYGTPGGAGDAGGAGGASDQPVVDCVCTADEWVCVEAP